MPGHKNTLFGIGCRPRDLQLLKTVLRSYWSRISSPIKSAEHSVRSSGC